MKKILVLIAVCALAGTATQAKMHSVFEHDLKDSVKQSLRTGTRSPQEARAVALSLKERAKNNLMEAQKKALSASALSAAAIDITDATSEVEEGR